MTKLDLAKEPGGALLFGPKHGGGSCSDARTYDVLAVLVETRLYVLTGGPCAGKTTLIDALRERGFSVVAEAATQILHEEGEGVRRSPVEFQKKIFARQLQNEERVLEDPRSTAVVFADRGLGDHFAYLRVSGCEPFPELLQAWEAARVRYDAVFILEMNPDYRNSGRRSETEEWARHIHQTIRGEYLARHPRVMEVPWMPVDARVGIVLRAVGGTPDSPSEPI